MRKTKKQILIDYLVKTYKEELEENCNEEDLADAICSRVYICEECPVRLDGRCGHYNTEDDKFHETEDGRCCANFVYDWLTKRRNPNETRKKHLSERLG